MEGGRGRCEGREGEVWWEEEGGVLGGRGRCGRKEREVWRKGEGGVRERERGGREGEVW